MWGPRLKNKVAFITGGGEGIGRATAERFAMEGARVVVTDINPKTGHAAAQSARDLAGKSGGDACFIHCDVTSRESVAKAFVAAAAWYGEINILFNNAGGSSSADGPVTEVSEDEFWRVIKVDLYGTFLCSKIGIPYLIKAGGGVVINMTSKLELIAGRDCYIAAKGGVTALTRSMAEHYAHSGVRVNGIAPSAVMTARVKKLLADDPRLEMVSSSHLLGLAYPVDIANMALYLACGESALVTGQIISNA